MAQRTTFRDFACSTAQTLEVVGEWWTLLIVRDAFFGVSRFDDFQRRLGLARSVLAQRLERLVAEDVLATHRYEEHPPRHEYRLTRKGRDLFPVLVALQQWGDKWASPKPPVVLRHRACGNVTHPYLVCSVCGGKLGVRDTVAEAGPGGSDPNMLPVSARRPTPDQSDDA